MHPDLCYLAAEGRLSTGPLGHYHSALAYSAYRSGVSVDGAVELFSLENFEALGYLNSWDEERDRFLQSFTHFGMDLSDAFVRWTRSGPFMYTINHPKMNCLRDVARLLLLRAGLQLVESDLLPYDNLANGPVFPVYPELGEKLGVRGFYAFKSGGAFRAKLLKQFVAESYAVYRDASEEVPSMAPFFPLLDRVAAFIRGLK